MGSTSDGSLGATVGKQQRAGPYASVISAAGKFLRGEILLWVRGPPSGTIIDLQEPPINPLVGKYRPQ